MPTTVEQGRALRAKRWESWKSRAAEVHHNRYTYPSPDEDGAKRIRVVCPEHGEFWQAKTAHLAGRGCARCAGQGLPSAAWVAKFQAAHPHLDFSKTTYSTSTAKVIVRCPAHGEFKISPVSLLRGSGCPKCGVARRAATHVVSAKAAAERLAKRHGTSYTYDWGTYTKFTEKMKMICRLHGEFWQLPTDHERGFGCPACGRLRAAEATSEALKGVPNIEARTTFDEFVAKAQKTHGNRYSYQAESYTKSTGFVTVICRKHGAFSVRGARHLAGLGCPGCSQQARRDAKLKPLQLLLRDFAKVHGDRYDYSQVAENYGDSKTRVTISCAKHGAFSQIVNDHLQGHGCPACGAEKITPHSAGELEVAAFLKSTGLTVEGPTRRNLTFNELDIYLPEKNLAIEYDGLYWHGELNAKGPRSHIEKTEEVEALGGRLIHIFEDEWKQRPEAVKARLLSILGFSSGSGGARSFDVCKAPWHKAAEFLDIVHLQGAGTPGRWNLTLERAGEIHACMTVGKARYGREAEYEILRFAAIGAIAGGFSRLLKAWTAEVPAGTTLISYADRRWSQGNVYRAAGFHFAGETRPGYWWCRGGSRYSRQRFQKHRLGDLLPNFDPGKTEVENMHTNGYWRVWDCGVSRWLYVTPR